MEPDSSDETFMGMGFSHEDGSPAGAGRDLCEQSGKGPSVKTQVQEGWCCPGEFPRKKERKCSRSVVSISL